jgi:hypothetical protein
MFSAWRFDFIIGTQGVQGRFLFGCEPLYPSDIEAFIGAVTAQGPYQLSALHSPQFDGAVNATTGDQTAIGAHLHGMDGVLVGLTELQELPSIHIPPAYDSIIPS